MIKVISLLIITTWLSAEGRVADVSRRYFRAKEFLFLINLVLNYLTSHFYVIRLPGIRMVIK